MLLFSFSVKKPHDSKTYKVGQHALALSLRVSRCILTPFPDTFSGWGVSGVFGAIYLTTRTNGERTKIECNLINNPMAHTSNEESCSTWMTLGTSFVEEPQCSEQYKLTCAMPIHPYRRTCGLNLCCCVMSYPVLILSTTSGKPQRRRRSLHRLRHARRTAAATAAAAAAAAVRRLLCCGCGWCLLCLFLMNYI